MRIASLAFLGGIGLAISAIPANAAPTVPSGDNHQVSNVIQVAEGCGRGAHRNRWSHCVPNGYHGYGPHAYGQGNFAAEHLNRQELGRMSGGGYYR
jgi:hypothetical protein